MISTDEMLEMVALLVSAESPSADIDAVRSCADVLADISTDLLGVAPACVELGGRPHLRWAAKGAAKVLVLGHFDTVWPLGTTSRWPFAVNGSIATGPGVFDMKAGLVQGLAALAELGSLDGVELFVSSDEELGAPTSRETIASAARAAEATLVLEPSEAGALKVARKGCSVYRITARGRAAHAGLDPESGRNALVEIAHQAIRLQELARGATTVTPTLAQAGTAANTVPASATLVIDVRAPTPEEQERVREAVFALRPVVGGVEIEVTMTAGHPPMPREASAGLFERAQVVAKRLGMQPLEGVEVGGASDGNFTAAAGCPTLDGLGSVGAGAHAEGEHIEIDKMVERAALVAGLIDDLRRAGT